MKVLIAADSFKGTFTSLQVAELIEKGIKRACPKAQIKAIPMADGGEGTVDAILHAAGGEYVYLDVHGPLGDIVRAKYGITRNGIAVIEMSEASGIGLVPADKLNPLFTSTYGTGELVIDAVKRGCKKVIIGLGGSATNDGGAGFAKAIGVGLFDKDGHEIEGTGNSVGEVDHIDLSGMGERMKDVGIQIACDVDNPLCGENGASKIFGPQKGATLEIAERLDKNLNKYALAVTKKTGRDIMNDPGMGAAGGLTFAIMQFCNAKIRRGVEILLDMVNFDEHAEWADIIITGEGRVDYQTPYGKVPAGVAQHVAKYGKPVYAIAGFEGEGARAVYDHGINEIISAVFAPCTLEEAMSSSRENISRAAERLIRIIIPFMSKKIQREVF